jgi:hypothetical protein
VEKREYDVTLNKMETMWMLRFGIKIKQCILSTFEQTIFISSRQAPLYFPSKASHVHVVVINTQSQLSNTHSQLIIALTKI